MKTQCAWFSLLLFTFVPLNPGLARDTSPTRADKVLILDGSFVHDAGELGLNVTNWGLLGSRPSSSSSFSQAPSAEWPAGSRIEHLWAAGLWVGAQVDGVPRVSTGQFSSEILPDPDDPFDTIYRLPRGAAGFGRYPEPNFDDDGDGQEDEDPRNGADDDSDGLIDEDDAAIGDQHFRATMRDDEQLATDLFPDHTPLGIEVTQESFQWASSSVDDFVGFRFTIENIGGDTLNQVYVGMFLDPDIGSRDLPDPAFDDIAGFLTTTVETSEGDLLPVHLAYAQDLGPAPAGGVLGFAWVNHPTDPSGTSAPSAAGATGGRVFLGPVSYANGGDPVNDAQRYDALSQQDIPTLTRGPSDIRGLLSVGPFATLAPGEILVFDGVLVVGANRNGMLDNAKEATRVALGARFDRDGNPDTGPNGREYLVPWLDSAEGSVPTVSGSLWASGDGTRAQVEAEILFANARAIQIRREAGSLPARTWKATDIPNSDGPEGSLRLLAIDEDKGPWPRLYSLVYAGADFEQILDQTQLDLMANLQVELESAPNPFNPRTTIQYRVPSEGPVTLELLDSRGRVVRRLVDRVEGAGAYSVVWDGQDQRGRPSASGVYQIRLRAAQRVVTRPVTLVR